MTGAVARERLPNRRMNVTVVVEWHGRRWLTCVGFDRAGRVREVFLNGEKTGADYEGLLDDACILVSVMLQNGLSAAEIVKHLGREGAESNDMAASPIGQVAREIALLEIVAGPGVREAYAASDARLAGRPAP